MEEILEEYFPIHRCTKEQFEGEYEEDYYELNKDRFQFCATDPDAFLRGTRDSMVAKADHSYVLYELHKCTDDIRETVG